MHCIDHLVKWPNSASLEENRKGPSRADARENEKWPDSAKQNETKHRWKWPSKRKATEPSKGLKERPGPNELQRLGPRDA